jgi:antitoxin (DNA-binding transcriptional repressor) of toxin-antitoxin stability system
MTDVSVRELRNQGGQVLDRVLSGEQVVITRDGQPVAELRQLEPPGVDAAQLVRRWQHLPRLDPQRWKADVDAALDADL